MRGVPPEWETKLDELSEDDKAMVRMFILGRGRGASKCTKILIEFGLENLINFLIKNNRDLVAANSNWKKYVTRKRQERFRLKGPSKKSKAPPLYKITQGTKKVNDVAKTMLKLAQDVHQK